jgi:hypothetical protein
MGAGNLLAGTGNGFLGAGVQRGPQGAAGTPAPVTVLKWAGQIHEPISLREYVLFDALDVLAAPEIQIGYPSPSAATRTLRSSSTQASPGPYVEANLCKPAKGLPRAGM